MSRLCVVALASKLFGYSKYWCFVCVVVRFVLCLFCMWFACVCVCLTARLLVVGFVVVIDVVCMVVVIVVGGGIVVALIVIDIFVVLGVVSCSRVCSCVVEVFVSRVCVVALSSNLFR